MRRPAIFAITLAALGTLGGCACIYGEDPKETSLIVANETSRPITVTYAQSAKNTVANPVSVDQQVLPDNSVRFTGREGDRLTVVAGEAPPMVVEYSRRSQVLHVKGDGPAVTYDLRRGQVDPTKNPPK